MKANRLGITLRGDRNQCCGCSLFFNSSHAFDKHRTGSHGIDRRCMTEAEMLDKGMVLGADGFWRGSVMPPDLRTASSDEASLDFHPV